MPTNSTSSAWRLQKPPTASKNVVGVWSAAQTRFGVPAT